MAKKPRPLDEQDFSRIEILKGVMDELGVARNDDIIEAINNAHPEFWPEDWQERALVEFQKQLVRKTQKLIQDETGFPEIANIQTVNPQGELENLWKHEAHLEKEDYKYLSEFHFDRGLHHFKIAKGYVDRARRRYSLQIRLPFPEGLFDVGKTAGAGSKE
jgi:hypothetical protein